MSYGVKKKNIQLPAQQLPSTASGLSRCPQLQPGVWAGEEAVVRPGDGHADPRRRRESSGERRKSFHTGVPSLKSARLYHPVIQRFAHHPPSSLAAFPNPEMRSSLEPWRLLSEPLQARPFPGDQGS